MPIIDPDQSLREMRKEAERTGWDAAVELDLVPNEGARSRVTIDHEQRVAIFEALVSAPTTYPMNTQLTRERTP